MSSGSSSFITPPHQQGKAIAALAEKLLLMHPEPPKKAEAPEGGVKTDYLGVRRDPEETDHGVHPGNRF